MKIDPRQIVQDIRNAGRACERLGARGTAERERGDPLIAEMYEGRAEDLRQIIGLIAAGDFCRAAERIADLGYLDSSVLDMMPADLIGIVEALADGQAKIRRKIERAVRLIMRIDSRNRIRRGEKIGAIRASIFRRKGLQG